MFRVVWKVSDGYEKKESSVTLVTLDVIHKARDSPAGAVTPLHWASKRTSDLFKTHLLIYLYHGGVNDHNGKTLFFLDKKQFFTKKNDRKITLRGWGRGAFLIGLTCFNYSRPLRPGV